MTPLRECLFFAAVPFPHDYSTVPLKCTLMVEAKNGNLTQSVFIFDNNKNYLYTVKAQSHFTLVSLSIVGIVTVPAQIWFHPLPIFRSFCLLFPLPPCTWSCAFECAKGPLVRTSQSQFLYIDAYYQTRWHLCTCALLNISIIHFWKTGNLSINTSDVSLQFRRTVSSREHLIKQLSPKWLHWSHIYTQKPHPCYPRRDHHD